MRATVVGFERGGWSEWRRGETKALRRHGNGWYERQMHHAAKRAVCCRHLRVPRCA